MSQSAVDFLTQCISDLEYEWMHGRVDSEKYYHLYRDFIKQAKEMHKQEIIDAFKKGQALGFDDNPNYMAEQYYKETFKKD